MNSILKQSRFTLAAGLMLCGAAAASANTLITFQVDMSQAPFDPGSQTVAARGTFNGWTTAFPLTNNPSGANPSLWSGTTNFPGNGSVLAYKYTIEPGAIYEAVAEGGSHNRLATLPSASGASLVLPQVFYGDFSPAPVVVNVTFQVDMAQQINTGAYIPGTSSVYAPGFYNGFAKSDVLTNDPSILRTNQNGLVTSNVFTFTETITGSPGETIDYKYFIDTGANWDSPAANTGDPADNNNRFFNLANAATQKVPIVFFSDAPYAPVTNNNITFQVDMTAQILNGNFDPSTGLVELRGNFNSWGTQQILCTNNPTALNTNIYKIIWPITDGVGATEFYKFWCTSPVNTGWETMADNRSLTIVDASAQVLPLVFFSNVDPSDLLPADTTVTFTVSMTNAVGTDAYVFNPAVDQVFINGVPNGFGTWNTALPQLTNNPVGSGLYSVDILFPKGSPVGQTYKYGINGADDEAPSGANHQRYVRATATGSYVMPKDTFTQTPPTEPSFGNLKAAKGASGQVNISFLGRPGVHLQSATSLHNPVVWHDLLNTDGAIWSGTTLSSTNGLVTVTNVPTAGTTGSFYRLIKH